MKAPFSRILTAALVAFGIALGGCAASPSASSAPAGALAKDTKAELNYAIWAEAQRPFIEKNIADFNKTYPNIKVTVAVTPYKQYFAKLKTQAEASNLPDVFWMNGPNIQLFAGNDQLADLGGINVDWKNFPTALVDLYSNGGKHYGIPKDFDTIALWYNKLLFADAGVALPTDDWTWDDFNKAAREIATKLKSQGVYGIAADLTGGQESFYSTIFQAGGYVIDKGKSGYDQPASIEGLTFWSDLIKDGAMPSVQVMADTAPTAMFSSGKTAMIYSGTWQTPAYAKDYPTPADLNLVQLPKGKHEGTVIHGLANVFAKTSKNLDAAKAFAEFLGSKQAAMTEGAAGTTLPAFNGTQDTFLNAYPNWNLKAYTDSAKNSSFPYPVSQNTNAWANLEAELLSPGFAGAQPMDTAAKTMADKMNTLLAAEPK